MKILMSFENNLQTRMFLLGKHSLVYVGIAKNPKSVAK